MSASDQELSVDFADPLIAEDAQAIRDFSAEVRQHPDLSAPNLIADPEFLFVADEFMRKSPRKTYVALVRQGGKPLSTFPVEIGPEKNLPGEYISLFRHPTRLSSVGIACPHDAVDASLTAVLDATRTTWPKAVGWSLMGLDNASPWHNALVKLLDGCPRLEREAKLQIYVDLDEFETLDDYYASRSRHYKKSFRRGRNRLNEIGGYEYTNEGPDGPWAFEDIARIDALTWRAEEKEGETPKMLLRMCERTAALAESPEDSEIYALTVDGRPASMYYGLVIGDTNYGFKNTFDPEFAYTSPSIVAYHHFAGVAIERGVRRIELMATNAYARHWANRERFLSDDVIFFKTARGRAAHLAVTSARSVRGLFKGSEPETSKGNPEDA